ncbi:MAG: hypothetical protein R2795_17270 [Saprospiraceae bacterium]
MGLTKRRNAQLRTAGGRQLDGHTYGRHAATDLPKALGEGKTSQVAIIKVARRLLNRIRAVWLHRRAYDKIMRLSP